MRLINTPVPRPDNIPLQCCVLHQIIVFYQTHVQPWVGIHLTKRLKPGSFILYNKQNQIPKLLSQGLSNLQNWTYVGTSNSATYYDDLQEGQTYFVSSEPDKF